MVHKIPHTQETKEKIRNSQRWWNNREMTQWLSIAYKKKIIQEQMIIYMSKINCLDIKFIDDKWDIREEYGYKDKTLEDFRRRVEYYM